VTDRQVLAHLVVGDDPYLVNEAVSKALAGIDPLSIEEIGPAEDRSRVARALESTTIFGGRRAVVVRGVDEAPAELARGLGAYLQDPNPDCLLVLTSTRPMAALAEAVRKVGHVADAGKGKRNDLFTWVREKARELGLRPTGEGMGALIETVGEERMALAQALQELALALGAGGRIGPEEVARQFQGRAQVSTFAFLDAVATGQTGLALQALRRLLDQGESPQVLLAALARHVRSLIEVGEGPAAKVAQALGMHPFRAEKLVRQAAGFPQPALAQAYREIAAADRRTKSGDERDDLALEHAVVAVAALRGPDPAHRGRPSPRR
jgi:DNA polymerase-3 subunit delta